MSPLRCLLVTCISLLAFAAQAQANPDIDRNLRIAYAGLPTNPCVGQVVVSWQANLTGTNDEGVVVPADGLATGVEFYPDGTTVLKSCDITLDTSLIGGPPERLCDSIVHEVWHLAGVRHTNDGTVMNATGAGPYPLCHPKLTRRQEAKLLVGDILPSQGSTRPWRITCNPRLTRCRARAPGVRLRRYSVHNIDGLEVREL